MTHHPIRQHKTKKKIVAMFDVERDGSFYGGLDECKGEL